MNSDALSVFKSLIQGHDLFYQYTDSVTKWKKGEESLRYIRQFIKNHEIDRDAVRKMWNAMVNYKVSDKDWREEFYWRG